MVPVKTCFVDFLDPGRWQIMERSWDHPRFDFIRPRVATITGSGCIYMRFYSPSILSGKTWKHGHKCRKKVLYKSHKDKPTHVEVRVLRRVRSHPSYSGAVAGTWFWARGVLASCYKPDDLVFEQVFKCQQKTQVCLHALALCFIIEFGVRVAPLQQGHCR
jgi:hypothetical protein